jgi:hypothetical protein
MKKHKYLTIENSMENDDEEDEDSSSELYKIDINIGNNLTKTLVINAKNNLQELDDFFNQYEIPFEKRTNITNNIIKQIGEPFFKSNKYYF